MRGRLFTSSSKNSRRSISSPLKEDPTLHTWLYQVFRLVRTVFESSVSVLLGLEYRKVINMVVVFFVTLSRIKLSEVEHSECAKLTEPIPN